ncbi:hypothetical protein [Shinella sp.]
MLSGLTVCERHAALFAPGIATGFPGLIIFAPPGHGPRHSYRAVR